MNFMIRLQRYVFCCTLDIGIFAVLFLVVVLQPFFLKGSLYCDFRRTFHQSRTFTYSAVYIFFRDKQEKKEMACPVVYLMLTCDSSLNRTHGWLM